MEWIVLLFRVPAEPSRHRVAVWRELRRTGAVSLGQSAWLAPAARAFTDGISRAVELVEAAGGEAIVLDASGHQRADADRLAAVYTAAREAEWVEFVAECGKYLAEIDAEITKGKLTLAELDEEEQSLERLRRWHRELRLRDVLGAPSAAGADRRLKACEAKLRTTPTGSSRPSPASEPRADRPT